MCADKPNQHELYCEFYYCDKSKIITFDIEHIVLIPYVID